MGNVGIHNYLWHLIINVLFKSNGNEEKHFRHQNDIKK